MVTILAYYIDTVIITIITLLNHKVTVCMFIHGLSLSCVWLFATLWTVVCQAPPFMWFSSPEYWSGLPCPIPRDSPNPGNKPMPSALQMHSLLLEPLGKLLLPIRESNPGLPHNRQDTYHYTNDESFWIYPQTPDWHRAVQNFREYLDTLILTWYLFPLSGNTTLPYLHPEKPVCRSRSSSQNQTWSNELVPNRERSTSRLYCHPAYLTDMQSQSVSSVTQPCLTLCNPIDCSTPGLPVYHQLLEFTQTHVHRVGDAIQPSYPLLSPSRLSFNLSQHQGLFKCISSSHQVAKVLEFQLQHQSFQWIFMTDFP